jgi:hypothetical protein
MAEIQQRLDGMKESSIKRIATNDIKDYHVNLFDKLLNILFKRKKFAIDQDLWEELYKKSFLYVTVRIWIKKNISKNHMMSDHSIVLVK